MFLAWLQVTSEGGGVHGPILGYATPSVVMASMPELVINVKHLALTLRRT